MRACSANYCATTGAFTTINMSSGDALPSWITTTTSDTVLSIAPTDGSVKASNDWVIAVIYTPTAGSSNPAYTAVTITVTCEITSFAISGAGTTTISYNVFDSMKIIDGSTLVFTQSPSCGYTFTNSWTYTIPSGNAQSVASQGTAIVPSFEVQSDDTSKIGTYTLTLSNTITIGSG